MSPKRRRSRLGTLFEATRQLAGGTTHFIFNLHQLTVMIPGISAILDHDAPRRVTVSLPAGRGFFGRNRSVRHSCTTAPVAYAIQTASDSDDLGFLRTSLDPVLAAASNRSRSPRIRAAE